MLPEPVGQLGFWQLPGGKSEDQADHVRLLGFNSKSVEAKEDIHGLEGDTLVPIDERMIPRDTKPVGCRQVREIGLGFVVEPNSGSLQSGIEETGIPQPKRSAVLLDLTGVDRANHGGVEPPRLLHLASSRMALRYCLAPSS
jgi:hypothetical protein